MKKKPNRPKKISRFVYWAPRILSILFILFIMMFSLDIFGNGYNFWQTLVGLFMHNIPAFVLIAVLVISWKHELVGAVGFIIAGLAYIAWVLMKPNFQLYMFSWFIFIAGPAFLVGALFFLNWRKNRIGHKKRKGRKNSK